MLSYFLNSFKVQELGGLRWEEGFAFLTDVF